MIALAKAQGSRMNEKNAALTLVPLLWSCLHLLVNYRMTCIDPNLPSFAFGLVADVMLVLAFYHLARLLYGKPRPAALGFFSAVTITMAVSDLGGIGLGYLMGVGTLDWSAKMLLRGGLSVAACVMLAAELAVLCAGHTRRCRRLSPIPHRRPNKKEDLHHAVCMLFPNVPPARRRQVAGSTGRRRHLARHQAGQPTEQELRDWHRMSGLPLKRFFQHQRPAV